MLLSKRGKRATLTITAALALAACSGEDPGEDTTGGTGGTGGTTPPPKFEEVKCSAAHDPGPAPIRRLTKWEYDNTIRDLFRETTPSHPAAGFPADNQVGAFTNNAESQSVPPLLTQNLLEAAERIVTGVTPRLAQIVACKSGTQNTACATDFIASFGKRAFRRPLDTTEKASFTKLFSTTLGSSDFTTGIQQVLRAMLQSPQFLYRTETNGTTDGKFIRPSDWEMASRLSYTLWATMPDDTLFAAAEAGKLRTPEQISAQALRMVDSVDGKKRSREMAGIFHRQWLSLDRLGYIEKNTKVFPKFNSSIRTLQQREADAFTDSVFWQKGATVKDLFTAPFSVMNAELADFYGLAGPTNSSFVRVELNPAERGGILTLGALMTLHAKPNQTYPPGRGKFVRESMFCQSLPPPVAGVTAPEPDGRLTGRQRWEAHSQTACARKCHLAMEPVGLGFENFDGVGRYRAIDQGKPVDASGEVGPTGILAALKTDVDGKFNGAVELSKKLAGSAMVSDCIASQWFQFAYGRQDVPEDACNMQTLTTHFKSSSYRLRDLLLGLTQTDAFLYRRVAQ